MTENEQLRRAAFTTELALDRTVLAWIRTTLAIASFGFGLVGFFRVFQEKNPGEEGVRLHEAAVHFGLRLIVIGIAAMAIASTAHLLTWFQIRRGMAPANMWPLTIILAFTVVFFGLSALWTLVASGVMR